MEKIVPVEKKEKKNYNSCSKEGIEKVKAARSTIRCAGFNMIFIPPVKNYPELLSSFEVGGVG